MIDALFAGPWGPLLIFCLRIVDVSMGTTRVLLAMRNARALVPVIGFFEVLLWIFAVGSAIRNLDSPLHVFGYAAGFSAGTVVGLWLEEKLAVGLASIQIVSRTRGAAVAEALRARGFGVTEFVGRGREGKVDVAHTVARRRELKSVLAVVDLTDPEAFVSVEEPRAVRRGWMLSGRRK